MPDGITYFFIALGIALIVFGGSVIYSAYTTSVWPKANGVVIHSEVEKVRGGTGAWRPRVSYRYEVDGKEYVSSIINRSIKYIAGSYGFASSYTAIYPVGHEIIVYYDRNDVSHSVLFAGIHKVDFFFLILGAGVLVITLWVRTMVWVMFPA